MHRGAFKVLKNGEVPKRANVLGRRFLLAFKNAEN